MDKAWVYNPNRVSREYLNGARNFANQAQQAAGNPEKILCPCSICCNGCHQHFDEVYGHLVMNGMDPTYKTWVFHGENRRRFDEQFILKQRRLNIHNINIMSNQGESSRKAAKRAQKQMLATSLVIDLPSECPLTISDRIHGDMQIPIADSIPVINSPQKKKGRGKAKLKENPKRGELKVDFNERGQPIGKYSQQFVSSLGTITKEIVPVTLIDWDGMSNEMADGLWELIQERFKVDDCHRKMTFSTMRRLWRDHKWKLTRKIKVLGDNQGDITTLKPTNVKSNNDWHSFVKAIQSKKISEKSAKFKRMRSKENFPYTTSRKGYACLEDEMKQESDSSNSISKVKVWIKGHLRKDDTPLNEEIGETVQKLEECSQESKTTSSIRDDALTKVLGVENQGQVRGLGFGATTSMMDAHESWHKRDNENEAKMQKMRQAFNERFEGFQSELQQLRSILSKFTSSVLPNNTLNVQPPEDAVNCDCEILHWSGSGEIVGVGKVDSTDPNAEVDGNLAVGMACWKVSVTYVYNSDVPLYRASPNGFYLKDFVGNTIAWPSNCIKLTRA